MVAVDENFYVTNGVLSADTITGGTTVKISTGTTGGSGTPIEFSYVANPIKILQPIVNTKAKGGTGTFRTRIKDLLKTERVITVNGFLSEETGTTALSKRNNLDVLMERGGILTAVWGKTLAGESADTNEQQTFTGTIIKLTLREGFGKVIEGEPEDTSPATGRVQEPKRFDRNFAVQLQFLVAEAL